MGSAPKPRRSRAASWRPAARFLLHRLPEVFAGTSRDDSPFPVQYLGANVPQAWAAGSVFSLLHALVGPSIDVDSETFYVDPYLPDWLPEIVIESLSVGRKTIDFRIWREGNETRAELLRGDGVTLARRPYADSLLYG